MISQASLFGNPQERKVIRFKYIAETFKGRLPKSNSSKDDLSVPYLSMEYLRGNEPAIDFVDPTGLVMSSETDVILLWDGSNAGEFLRGKYGAISSTTALVKPICIDCKFLFWISKSIEPILRMFTNGMGIPHVDNEFLKNIKLLLPELPQQKQISDYLDLETTQIDNLIAAKEQMLTLLEEKREALISHAVTRGLDPNVSFKRSGLDWLGDIPQHWNIRKLKFLAQNIEQGSSPQASNIPAEPDELGILKLSAVYKGQFLRHENKALQQADDAVIHTLSLREGDVLITRGNTPQLVGDVCVVPSNEPNLLLPDLIYRLTIQESKILPEFLSLFLITPQARSQIQSDARGSSGSMVKISQGHILDWRIPVPPKHEQESIIHAIEYEKEKNKELKNALTDSIALLKERRSALITAAVTGKIALEEMKK